MKRTIAAFLIITLLAPSLVLAQSGGSAESGADTGAGAAAQATSGTTSGPRSNADSYNQGVMDAEDRHTAVGWGVGGFVAGGLFSWLGTGVIMSTLWTVLVISAAQ